MSTSAAATARKAACEGGDVVAVNLRDIAEISPHLTPGVVYRCSQVYNEELLKRLKIKTIVDLRGRTGKKAKKKAEEERVRRQKSTASLGRAPSMSQASLAESTASDTEGEPTTAPQLLHDDDLELIHAAEDDSAEDAAPPMPRRRHELVAIHRDTSHDSPNGRAFPDDTRTASDQHGSSHTQRPTATTAELTAVLADPSHLNFNVVPTKQFGWKVLKFPKSVWLHSAHALVTGGDARKPFVDAFADEQVLGFTKYYILMLDHAQHSLASVLRVFKEPAHLPALIHCAHGKDRTGVVIMLLLMMCGVPLEQITADYIQSEQQLRLYRETLGLDNVSGASALIPLNDVIIQSTAETIKAVYNYVLDKYGPVEDYLHHIGLTADEIKQIKENIMSRQGAVATKGAEGTPALSALSS